MNTLLLFNIILKFKSIVDIISIILFSIISDLNLKLSEPDHFLLIPRDPSTIMTYKVSYIFVDQLRRLFPTILHLIYCLVVASDFIWFTANFFLTDE